MGKKRQLFRLHLPIMANQIERSLTISMASLFLVLNLEWPNKETDLSFAEILYTNNKG